MGGMFSGITRERRLDKLHQLVLDIKHVKSELGAEKRRRRLFFRYTLLAVIILMPIVLGCSMLIFNSSWWIGGFHSALVLLLGIAVYSGSKYYYDWRHRQNFERLNALKEEKTKILDVIKNTESYAVVKELLDQCGSDDEIENPRAELIP